MAAEDSATDAHVNASGWLEVGGGHRVYWEDWGNPKAKTPVMFLHGGPGGGFHDSHKAPFDPELHRVVFFDQRGAGRSTPFAGTEHNTTQDLLADMERLREHLSIERMHVMGGSWGSTLALMYAIRHPQRVVRLLLRSVFLARKQDLDWVNGGGPRQHFPEEWARFIELVPKAERGSGDHIMQYYAEQMRSEDEVEARTYALEWNLWEGALMSINYDPQLLEAEVSEDPNALAVARLETHYFMNDCFVPENYILDNIAKIRQIPCEVVHGRFDLCTLASGAYDLAQAYGENLKLRWVNSGHRGSDPEMREVLRVLAAEHLR